MFKEKELTVKEILKIADGLQTIMNEETSGEEGKERNVLPFKTSYKIGRFADQLEKTVSRYQKLAQQAWKDAETEIEKKLKKEKNTDISTRDRVNRRNEIFNDKMEGINDEKETVKVLEKPLTEDEFEDFIVPSSAFKNLGDYIKIE